jgi:2-amino-4-hydroxy-6-hydroxymethyldihydropteridine diphosphokinase
MRAYLSVGSNLGERRRYLRHAVETLPDVVAVSPVYETDPVGGPPQDAYLNLVVELDTELTPQQLLGVCHRIETSAERVRDVHWGPRTLDIDIIWMDGVELTDAGLTIPHPRWKERRFVLAPLRDLAPDLVSERDLHLSDGAVKQVPGL